MELRNSRNNHGTKFIIDFMLGEDEPESKIRSYKPVLPDFLSSIFLYFQVQFPERNK
jgi:hypothetical protein